MKTWITLSIVVLIPMILRAPKALLPLRVNRHDTSRFAGLFRRYAIHTFTGIADDADKRSDDITTGSVSSTLGSDGHPSSVSGSIRTQVVVTDRFFLTDSQGKVESFEGSGFNARVGNGHTVSLAWVIHGFRKSGPYFLIYNHTTGETFFNDQAITKRLTLPYPTLYIGLLCIMILPLPVVLLFGLIERWQRFRFERAGVKPLLRTLDTAAASFKAQQRPGDVQHFTQSGASPTPGVAAEPTTMQADPATSLKEMAVLRDAGAITEAEFSAAKAKILRKQW